MLPSGALLYAERDLNTYDPFLWTLMRPFIVWDRRGHSCSLLETTPEVGQGSEESGRVSWLRQDKKVVCVEGKSHGEGPGGSAVDGTDASPSSSLECRMP